MSVTANNNGNGRLPDGRFGKGNSFSLGNPHGRRVARIRAAILRIADPRRIERAVEVQMKEAEGGDLEALKFILDYSGAKPPTDTLILMRLEEIERKLSINRGDTCVSLADN
ncbi:MAG: hypothetical protein ABSB33_03330, partial [Tepidisphaeraceae bacterium]|jgi:hypothetical protein